MAVYKKLLIWIFLTLSSYNLVIAQDTDPVVIVVHPSNDRTNISLNELRLMYRGRKKHWDDGQKILVLNRPVDSDIRRKFYRSVFASKPDVLFFKPGSPVAFKTVMRQSDRSVRRQVSRIQNVIGYMHLSNVNASVKILKVENKAPTEPGYILE